MRIAFRHSTAGRVETFNQVFADLEPGALLTRHVDANLSEKARNESAAGRANWPAPPQTAEVADGLAVNAPFTNQVLDNGRDAGGQCCRFAKVDDMEFFAGDGRVRHDLQTARRKLVPHKEPAHAGRPVAMPRKGRKGIAVGGAQPRTGLAPDRIAARIGEAEGPDRALRRAHSPC